MTTSSRIHGEFLRLLLVALFLDNAFRFKRAAFYMGLKSKDSLVAAKSSVLQINLNIQGCSVVAPSFTLPLTLPFFSPSFFHTISLSPAFTSARWAD